MTTNNRRLFLGCFIALVTCAFGFIVRTQVIGEWQTQFNLDETQKGDILGVGFWPFAFSIFAFAYLGPEKTSVFGKYRALDQAKLASAPQADSVAVEAVRTSAKKNALSTAAIFPVIMLLCYIALILHFRARGGYRPAELVQAETVTAR